MDAVYPGSTGHALIANDILRFLNSTYQVSFPLINPATVAANDLALTVVKPRGTVYTPASLNLPMGASTR
jgi:hypothetical protein